MQYVIYPPWERFYIVPDIYSIPIIFGVDGNQIKTGEVVDTLVRKYRNSGVKVIRWFCTAHLSVTAHNKDNGRRDKLEHLK